MACNSCAKSFSLLRHEKGCPGCGFSFCSKCLNHKIFLEKLNSEAKVCVNCKRISENGEVNVKPPDVYYRSSVLDDVKNSNNNGNSEGPGIDTSIDQQIQQRLMKLKQQHEGNKELTSESIENRLQKLKGDISSVTDTELQIRLANIKGVPVPTVHNKPLITTEKRSEQQQADDLLNQYLQEANISSAYKDDFDGVINNIEMRLQKLKGASTSGTRNEIKDKDESNDEETTIRKIIEKAKGELELDDDVTAIKELPFCEICNEDARMRCKGCKYLFCKVCFMEHKDDDDGCNAYELYNAN